MRCPRCSYFFSEELKACPRCGADMGLEIERLGIFPPGATEPFLTIEDFQEPAPEFTQSPFQRERLIDLPLGEEEAT